MEKLLQNSFNPIVPKLSNAPIYTKATYKRKIQKLDISTVSNFCLYTSNKIRKTQNEHLNIICHEQSVIVNLMPIS